MAERTILVCDVCGQPAVETVTFKVGRRNLQKDYCSVHRQELTAGARAPHRGRRRGAVVAAPAKRRGRPKKTTTSTRRSSKVRTAAASPS